MSKILALTFTLIMIVSQCFAEVVTTKYYEKIIDVYGGIINSCTYPRPIMNDTFIANKISNDMCRVFDRHCDDIDNYRRNFLNTYWHITCDDSDYLGVYFNIKSLEYPGDMLYRSNYRRYTDEYFRMYSKRTGERLYCGDFASIPSVDVLKQGIINGQYKVFKAYQMHTNSWDREPFGGSLLEEKENNYPKILSKIDSISTDLVIDAKHNVYLMYHTGDYNNDGKNYYAVRIKPVVQPKQEVAKPPERPLVIDRNLSFSNIKFIFDDFYGLLMEGDIINNNNFPITLKKIQFELTVCEEDGSREENITPQAFIYENGLEISPYSSKRIKLKTRISWFIMDDLRRKYKNMQLSPNANCKLIRYQ